MGKAVSHLIAEKFIEIAVGISFIGVDLVLLLNAVAPSLINSS